MNFTDINHAVEEFKKDKHPLAFKHIYNSLSGKLYYLCLRYLKKEEDAQDILQETFVTVYHKFDSYTGQGSFEGWIKRIIVNNCLQKLKLDKKQFIIKDMDSSKLENIGEEQEDSLEKEIIEEKLLKALKELPDNYRTILNLAILEEYSHKEIATILNITENTSRIQLLRARTALKEKLS